MAFTAADVKNLREMTGVGMLDCKKALAETDGDMDKAVELLREKGLAAAQKKAGRIAAEGMAYAEVFSDGAALVEVNAETDFVAKNAQFIEFVKDVCYVVGKWGPVDMDTLMTLPYRKTGMTVQQALQDKIMVIGENIKIRRFVRYDSGVSVAYNHMNGRIGVLLNMEVSAGLEENEKVQELGKDLAMQIAAMNPAYLDKSDVSQDTLDKEKEIHAGHDGQRPQDGCQARKGQGRHRHGQAGQVLRGELPDAAGFRQGEQGLRREARCRCGQGSWRRDQDQGLLSLRERRGPGEEGRELRRGDRKAAGQGLIA